MKKLNRELVVGLQAFFYGLCAILGALCLIIGVLIIYPFYWVSHKE